MAVAGDGRVHGGDGTAQLAVVEDLAVSLAQHQAALVFELVLAFVARAQFMHGADLKRDVDNQIIIKVKFPTTLQKRKRPTYLLLSPTNLLGAERFTKEKDGGHLSGKHVVWIDLWSGSQEASIEGIAGRRRHEPRHFRRRDQLTVDVTLQFTFGPPEGGGDASM